MPVGSDLNRSRVLTGLLILLAISPISKRAFAQSDSTAKRDFLSGYQWLHPAGRVAPAATCSVQPKEVVVGDPVTATVVAGNFNPKHTLTYLWNPSNGGGKVIGKDADGTDRDHQRRSRQLHRHRPCDRYQREEEQSSELLGGLHCEAAAAEEHAYDVYRGQPGERRGRWNCGFDGQLHQP